MQFKVPQDVQREDTIIGPITMRQLIILGVGGAIAYAIYISLAKTYFIEIWLPPVAIVSLITLAVAFLKIHSLPFHIFLMNFIEYHLLPRQRFWIEGSGTPFISSFDREKKALKKDHENMVKKEQKTIEELSSIVDSKAESKEAKHEELDKIIQQNFQNKNN